MSHNLTVTTIALMKYVKSLNPSFNWVDVRDLVLGKLYHYDMTLPDVFHIVTDAYLNARNEPRLKMHYDNDTAIRKAIIEPISKITQCVRLTDTFTVEEICQSHITHMLHELRYTSVDWIDDWALIGK